MKDSKEFTDILSKVPLWNYLTPGQEWREADHELHQSTLGSWWIECFRIRDAMLRYLKIEAHQIARRPIPEHVRRSMAWWALYNKLATVSPEKNGWQFHIYPDRDEEGYIVAFHGLEYTHNNYGVRKFVSEEAARMAVFELDFMEGNDSALIKHLSEGPVQPMQWIMEAP